MVLWIRSQNQNELLLATRVYIQNTNIRAIDYEGYSVNIGIYESRERALEVLDDIQNIICGNTHPAILKGAGAISDKAKNIFYQMPEE